MRVNRQENTYNFFDESNNRFLSFTYKHYPSCCLMGILHGFSLNDNIFKNHISEVNTYVKELMRNNSINQILIADIENGGGYILANSLDGIPLNVSFNRNSGNFVYLFAIYNEIS